MKTGKDRLLVAPSTRTQSRVVLYEATQRPSKRTGAWQVTSYGRVRVTGRLGQRHADLVEAICACAEKARGVPDGGVELLVDPYRVRRCMSGGHGQYSYQRLHALLFDLRAAIIEIETPDLERRGEKAIGGLIDHWLPTASAPDPLHGHTERRLWRVRLGTLLVMLLRADAPLWRDPAPLAALESGVSQALARHVLTQAISAQPPGGWWLDTLLKAVGVGDGASRRKARMAVRSDVGGLAKLGIRIVGRDRIQIGAEDGISVPQRPGGVEDGT